MLLSGPHQPIALPAGLPFNAAKKLECPQPSPSFLTKPNTLLTWEVELANDPDRHFLLNGLKYGFRLVDIDPKDIEKQTADNHKSALKHRIKVEHRLREEIQEGNYVKLSADEITLISPLAAIEKSDGDVRLIHDLSYSSSASSSDHSLNSYASKDECIYESLTSALDILEPGMWMAKVDLKWAYRSVPLHKDQYVLTGLQWQFEGDNEPTTLVDTTFPFGARKSPAHFNRITKAIKRMMVRKGYNCTVFLDDFLLYEQSFTDCATSLATLITLLRALGFRINWKKVCDPTQKIVFLGVEINTVDNKLTLDPSKTQQTIQDITTMLEKKRVSKRHMQKMAGRLHWCSTVMTWGRAYINSFYQGIRQLNKAMHKMRVTSAMLEDLKWWLSCLQNCQHCRAIWPDMRQAITASSDASLVGGGAFLHSTKDWTYTNWALDWPIIADEHINNKELMMIGLVIRRWGPVYPGYHFFIQTDNITAAQCINKGYARNYHSAKILKNIATLAQRHKITMSAHYLPGVYNEIPDSISRLHSQGQCHRLSSLLSTLHGPLGHPTFFLPAHMSYLSWVFLFPQVMNFHRWPS